MPIAGFAIGRVAWWAAVQAAVVLACSAAQGQQRLDPDFDTSVAKPAYPSEGPRVCFDEGHHNFHTSTGRYKPFADLIGHDGYRVKAHGEPFTRASLAECDVLVIANALGAARMGSREAADPAFTDAECDAVRDWVEGGGALLLITDHYPTGMAAQKLGERFGVKMSGGLTEEYEFTPEKGLAADHPIMRGRSEGERINRVRTFTGQSLEGPEGSVTLLTLPEDAQEKTPNPVDPHGARPIDGKAKYAAQAVALPAGKGRVVVLGEAAMLTAQVAGEERFGMNQPGIDNRQLALNIMHWLSGLMP